MSLNCAFHPTQPAWWQCPRCAKALCPHCIERRQGGPLGSEPIYFCPRCNQMAESLGISHIIPPFWKRLHTFFGYPLTSIHSLGLIFGLALLSILFNQPGIFMAILRFVIWAVMVKYAYEALRATAEGHFSPPPLSGKVLSDNFQIVLKQVALFFALFLILVLLIAPLGPIPFLLASLFMTLGLPAMIIILATSKDLGQALNPVNVIGLAYRIGGAYLLLLFFLYLLFLAPRALGYYVIRFMPDALQTFLVSAAENYYTLLSYHLMGYVIIQYHDRLDYPVDLEKLMAAIQPTGRFQSSGNAGPPQKASDPNRGLLQEIEHLIQDGNIDGAIDLIQTRTALKIDQMDLSDRYVSLLKIRNRTEEWAAYAPRHIELAVSASEKAKAIEVYLGCVEKNPEFTLSPALLFRIGGWLNETNRSKEAVQAFIRLAKKYPQDPLIPKTYYCTAQILHEKLMNTEQAKKILTALLQKFPKHEIAAFAHNYLGTLK